MKSIRTLSKAILAFFIMLQASPAAAMDYATTRVRFAERLSDLVTNNDPRLIGLVTVGTAAGIGGTYIMAKSVIPSTVQNQSSKDSIIKKDSSLVSRGFKFALGFGMLVGSCALIWQAKNILGFAELMVPVSE